MAAADDDSSDLSSLSSLSPVPSDAELDDLSDDAPTGAKSGILKFFSKLSEQPPKEPSPPPRKRSPSPPHEYVLADNPDIAVCFSCLANPRCFSSFSARRFCVATGAFTVSSKREISRADVIRLTNRLTAVSGHVSKPLQRRIPQIPRALRTAGIGTRRCRAHPRRSSRTFSMRRPRTSPEPETGCQVMIGPFHPMPASRALGLIVFPPLLLFSPTDQVTTAGRWKTLSHLTKTNGPVHGRTRTRWLVAQPLPL